MTLTKRIAYFTLMAVCAAAFVFTGHIGALMVSPAVELISLAGEAVAVVGMFFAILTEA